MSKITIDTRFGVPDYDGNERYALDGDDLVPMPVSTTASCVDGLPGRVYRRRVASGFDRIVRCGSDVTSYHFEVTRTDGTLLVYGTDASSRLAAAHSRNDLLASYGATTSAKAGAIATWYLGEVIDPNGNVTEYQYDADDLTPAGGEPSRQVYLAHIVYTGRGDRRAGTVSASGPFTVDLVSRDTDDDGNPWKDINVSGRLGFKVETRKRLVEIDVRRGSHVIRSYSLKYEYGDFDRSLLTHITAYGEGGTTGGHVFYAHSFSYTQKDHEPGGNTVHAFKGPTAWPTQLGRTDPNDHAGISSSLETSDTAHVYTGIGVTWDKGLGSVGLRVGQARGTSTTRASLVDLNGDGLPDRLTWPGAAPNGGGAGAPQIYFNEDHRGLQPSRAVRAVLASAGIQLPSKKQSLGVAAFSATPPAWDPAVNASSVTVNGLTSLGSSESTTLDGEVELEAGIGVVGVSGSYGISSTTSTSRDYLTDANGDGLVDLVSGGIVDFNQDRSSMSPNFTFAPYLTMKGHGVGGPGTDTAATDAKKNAAAKGIPADVFTEWTAPWPGTVHVSGPLKFKKPSTADCGSNGATDGVRLQVFHYTPGNAATRLVEVDKPYCKDQGNPSPVGVGDVSVKPGDRLYFVLSTLKDVPVGANGSQGLLPLEELSYDPTITYTGSIVGEDARQPDGADIYSFHPAADLRLAGGPVFAVTVAHTGTVALDTALDKKTTADDLRACIEIFDPTTKKQPHLDRPCRPTDPHLDLRADESFWNAPVLLQKELNLKAGTQLVFRIESDLPFDPKRVRWRIHGRLKTLCDSPGSCNKADPSLENLKFEAVPYIPLHDRLLQFHRPINPGIEAPPPKPLIMGANGTLTIVSHLDGTQLTPAIGSFVYAAVQAPGHLLYKRLLLPGGRGTETTHVTVTKDEPVYFELHGSRSFDYSGSGPWRVDAYLTTIDAKGKKKTVQLDPIVAATADAPGFVPPYYRAEPAWKPHPEVSGGFHHLAYGIWRAPNDEPFDPRLLEPPQTDDWPSGDPAALLKRKDELEKTDTQRAKQARYLAPLVAAPAGCRCWESGGRCSTRPTRRRT